VLAQILTDRGELDRADALASRALATREAAFGPDHPDALDSAQTVANVAWRRDDRATARAIYERVVAGHRRAATDPGRGLAQAAGALAALIEETGDFAGAEPRYLEALAALEASLGKDHVEYARVEGMFADGLINHGRCADAAPRIDHVIAVMEASAPANLPWPLGFRARCAVAAGRPAEAIAPLRQAIALCERHGCMPGLVESMRFELGRAMVESGRDRAGGRGLVERARGELAALGDDDSVAEIDAWLARARR
jgi:tetratricopeptide (TPR) repeat protein